MSTDSKLAEVMAELRKCALECDAFHAAGCPIEDETDIYPDDIWQAITRPEAIRTILDALEAAQRDNANLRTVMVAAAEEIHAHWQAHCDSKGYGPANLQRRLEEGIPSEYGYTAGAFVELKAALEAAQAALRELVAIEDAKKSMAQANHHAARFPTDENYAVIDRLSTDLARRRPLAWAAARAAIAQGDSNAKG